ncbi:murein biosynthesis integral membrane protein MurJ [Salinicoccus cyprini]|uniref:Probable lipid II flippase MurJ n=1 Tax=Salinicoccus cyprini TaxID=2493691 RepID=A0A558ASN1_9STAP|nr:murein biosynthesis integral membrane protein MurJ [Salinicoccus cyprini]TVT27275.1 murein biosynthesis integral membrane protein MurJ [Salinicoccus cyprini]
MKKAVILLMILTIVSKISGFFRDLTLAYFYGASEISDVFLLANSIPTIVFGVIAAGISTGYIPLYSRVENELGLQAGINYTNNLINVLLVGTTAIVILALIFTEYLVKVFAIGFEGETLALAVLFTRFSIFGIYFTIIIRILSAYLNYNKIFAVPSLIGIPMNFVLIAAIIISSRTDWILVLAIANVTALFVQFLIIIFFSHRHAFRFKPIFKPKDRHIKEMAALAFPVILGTSVSQLNRLVDRSLASWITVGGISSINYANTMNTAFIGIFVASFVTVFYPDISRKGAKGDMEGLKHTMNQTVLGVLILIIPATVSAMVLAEPIVRLLFDRGAFDETAVALTTSAFFFYAIGLAGTGVNLVLTRVFYALQDTKTPMINSAIAMGINLVLNFLLAPILGIGGLALATSISSLITVVLLTYQLRKKLGRLNLRTLIPSVIKMTGAAVIAAGAAFLLFDALEAAAGLYISMIAAISITVAIYFTGIILLKVEGVQAFINTAFSRFRRK